MDFFTRQEQARQKTKLLVFYFVLAVAGIVVSIYVAALGLGFFTGREMAERGVDLGFRPAWWNPELFGLVAVAVSAVVGLGSGWKSLQLNGGGGVVAQDLGGRPVPPQPRDPDEQRLRNVVEEMALASGTSVPEIYLLENEEAINAFAAGKTPGDSSIGVTRGCVQRLSRDELQGVIAHEFSHILNGDMRLNTRLIGLLHGILLIALIGRLVARSSYYMGSPSRRRDNDREGGGGGYIVIFGIALIVIGYIGVFFGKLIKSAVSRQREFLADASAVQFTRNPDGIGGALKKIGGSVGSRVASPNAEEASHLFFANGLTRALGGAFATHPPLEARIRALDPGWDGEFVASAPGPREQAVETRTPAQPPPLPGMGGAFPGNLPGGLGGVLAGGALASAGYSDAQVGAARKMHREVPERLRAELGDTSGASAVIFAVLLSDTPDVRARQLAAVEEFAPGMRDAVERLAADVSQAPSRLTLVDLALPALRLLSPAQFTRFNTTLEALIEADQQIELFEFAVKRMVQRQLGQHFGSGPAPGVRFRTTNALSAQIGTLLSAFAHLSGGEVDEAFQRGAEMIEGRAAGELRPVGECGLERIDAVLEDLAAAGPTVKKNVLFACAKVVLADREVTEQETELLRAVADSIDAPIPPVLTSFFG